MDDRTHNSENTNVGQVSTEKRDSNAQASVKLNIRTITLKQKLILGFGGLLLLMAINIGLAIVEMKRIENNAVNVIEVRQPIVVNLLEYSDKLNLATTYLNNYLLTSEEEHKKQYTLLESKLISEFSTISRMIELNGVKTDKEKLAELEALIPQFRQLGEKVIRISEDNIQNYPGMEKAAELLNPLALEYLSQVNNLLREEIQVPSVQHHEDIIVILNDIRYSWVQMMNSIRTYFTARGDIDLYNFTIQSEANQLALQRLVDLNVDIGFDGIADLQDLTKRYQANVPIVMEIYEKDVWRRDVVLMRTEIRPLVDKLRNILTKMSSTQLADSKKDGMALTESLSQIRSLSALIFIISAIMGITLAIVITRDIIPPINRLMKAAQQVAEGDLQTEVNQISRDEIGKLTSSFNTMVLHLRDASKDKQRYLKELEKWNHELEDRVNVKVNELQSTQNQLLQSEKLASIGQLAAGVAHEINNPVGYVNSNIGTLKKYIDDIFRVLDKYSELEDNIKDNEFLAPVNEIKREVELGYLRDDIVDLVGESQEGLIRVKQIVQDLKDFSHVDEAEWQWVDLHAGIDSTLNVAHNEIKYKAEVVKDYGDIPQVECMPSQLNQVFMNLFVNAAHAIEEMGSITVKTGTKDDEVFVAVTDTGKGMDEETRKRIFEPFFTTKPVGTGTGLGLSLSFGIIEKHHGRIELESEVGKGATFTIWLPIKQPESDEDKNSPKSDAA